jgi:tetratricopeptide (TPR) repeat protein
MRSTFALLLACAALTARASPESEALKRQGLAALSEGRFAQAGGHFDAAARADPRDTEAVFLRGAAANREGRFDVAEQSLRRAEASGLRNPELDFELGWSFMARGQFEACVVRLEKFDAAAPGRGQTSEFLGRCHLGLRQYERAEARLNEALKRDARLAPTVNLSLAGLEQARGRSAAAQARLQSAVAADAPTGRALRELAGPPDAPQQPDKPLRLSVSYSVGHNSNVIGLGNTIPLPADISRKGADFARLSAGASYTRLLEDGTGLTLGYAYLDDRYDGIGGANLQDHFVYADIAHQINARAAFTLRVSGEFTTLGGVRFRDVLSLRPALSYRFLPDSVTEFSWSLSDNDYLQPSAAAFNRDGETNVFSVVHSFRLRGTNWSGAVGASHSRNRAEGSDFDASSLGLTGTLRYSFANRMVAALGVSLSRDDYRNANSLAGGGFAFARDDRQQSVNAQLSGPLTDNVRWFAHAQALRNNSNIAFYAYKQTSITGGIAVDF